MNRIAALLVASLLSGCAAVAPGTPSPRGDAGLAATPAIDLASKFRAPREGKKRDRAAISADYNLRMEADEQGPPRAGQIFRAQAQREALLRETAAGRAKSAGLQPSRWQALGPANVGGRVRSFAIDPRNASRLFAGSASGGLWRSDDAGATWRVHFDFLPNLSVSTLAFDPLNPDTMYLGTGEASAGLVGVGVFKSIDAGASWQYLAATNPDANADWRFVNRVAVHPTQPQWLLAGVTNISRNLGGIYRSTDGGATWAKASSFEALDLAFEPSNPANAIAGLDDGGVAYSRDGGASWARTVLIGTPAGRGGSARIEVAFARSQPGVAYASVDNEKGEVWFSGNSGATWAIRSTPGHLGNQGDYDNAIWVDPTDASHVVVAGLDIHRSRDAGVSFEAVSDWRFAPSSPHADHHALVSPPTYSGANPVLYTANDGGIYRTANILTANKNASGNGWQNLNNGLAVTQFYSGAGKSAAGGRVIGGTQDNGSLMLPAGVGWSAWRGGDGGYVAVDPTDDRVMYGEYVYLSLHRTLNGGQSSTYICAGITEALADEDSRVYCGADNVQKSNFIAPFVLDPNDANRLVAGANSLWVTDGARAAAPAWRAIKPPSAATDNFINAVAVAEGNSNRIWVGHNNGEVYRSVDALTTAPSWTRVGQGVLPTRAVQRFMVDRDNPNRVLVAFTGFTTGNVWQTLDGGATWASLHANLPFAPVFDVKRHPLNASWLYAATSFGLYTSENGGAAWSTTNEGPANIRIRELFWKDNATLVAATYGRGMFQVAVAAGPAAYQDLWWAGPQENGWGLSITQHGASLFAAFFIYDTQGRAQWVVMPGGTWNASQDSITGALYIPGGSWFGNYDASRFAANASVGSATIAFSGTSNATLTYSINGVSGTKAIVRQPFGVADPTPVGSFADLWWGGTAQNGWGVAISQQYRTLFAVWYTYDAEGRTQWYVIPGGTWTSPTAFTGAAFRTTGSPWAGAAYNPAALVTSPAGTVTFTFSDAGNAVMSYTVDGVTQSKPLVRQPF